MCKRLSQMKRPGIRGGVAWSACLVCSQHFPHLRHEKRKCCSRPCQIAYLKNVIVKRGADHGSWKGGKKKFICQWCGIEKSAYVGNKNGHRGIFCSVACSKQGLALPIGTERIRNSGRVHIKVGRKKWRCKSTVLLGIAKTTQEIKSRIRYKDGNPKNCTKKNVVLLPLSKVLRRCPKCGKERIVDRKHSKTGLCHSCNYGKLQRSDVIAIKILLRLGFGAYRLAEVFHVIPQSIYNIKHGKRWRNIMAKHDWKTMFAEWKKMAASGRASAYELAKGVVAICKHPGYRRDALAQGRSVTDLIDKEVKAALVVRYIELEGMLKLFPKKEQWVGGDLSAMRDKFLSHQFEEQQTNNRKRKGNSTDKERKKPERVSLSEYNKLEQENQQLKAELAHTKEKYELVLQENSRLHEQVHDLRKLCNVLGGEVQETPQPKKRKVAAK